MHELVVETYWRGGGKIAKSIKKTSKPRWKIPKIDQKVSRSWENLFRSRGREIFFWVLRRVSERFHSRVVVFLRVFERYGGPVSAIRILASLLPLKKHRTDEMSDRRVTSLARSAQNDSCLMGVEWQQVEQ